MSACGGSAFAGEMNEANEYGHPWEVVTCTDGMSPQEPDNIREKDIHYGVPAELMMELIGFFSNTISRVDGDRCPMYPTCSAYGMEAIRTHGAVIGIVMIADRLIHEANEMDTAPLVEVQGRNRYYDPLSNNDFWWNRRVQP